MRALVYARQSSGDAEESESVELQVRELTATAKRMGLEVGGTYRDLDISGRHYPDTPEARTLCGMDAVYKAEYPKAEYREGLGQLLSDLRDGDTILVYDITRLMRPLSGSYLESYILNAVRRARIATKGGEVLDYGDFATSLTGSVLARINDHQIKLCREKSIAALNALKTQGPIGAKLAIGYRHTSVKRKFAVNEGEAEAVRTVYRRYLAGDSLVEIVRAANAVKTTPGTIQESTIRRMLARPCYAGMYRRPDGTLAQTDAFPPLVSKADWLKAQERMALRRTGIRYAHDSHPLAGLVFCGECGERMRVVRCGDRQDRKRRIAYLYCHRAYILKRESHPRIRLGEPSLSGRSPMPSAGQPSAGLPDAHLEKWATLLSGEKSTTPVPLERGLLPLIAGVLCREASQSDGQARERLLSLRNEMAELKTRRDNVLQLVAKGLASLDEAESALSTVKARLSEVEREILKAESEAGRDGVQEAIRMLAMLRADCLPRHVYSDCAHRAFRAIRIYKKRVAVELNDGTEFSIPRVSKNGGSYLPGWSLDVTQTETGWRARIIYHAKRESVLCDTASLTVETE